MALSYSDVISVYSATNLVSEPREELSYFLPKYELIRDVLAGEYAVKRKTTKYLPMPNPSDKSEDNISRYETYLQRAMFYNVTNRTVQGLVGHIFLRAPVMDLPENLQPLESNADGKGLTLSQLAKTCCYHTLAYGRCGLLSDYPRTESVVSVADIRNGNVQPTIRFFAPWDIVNWETKIIGGKEKLTMVILREYFEQRLSDTFKVEVYEQFRVIDLDEGVCRIRLYNVADKENVAVEEFIVRDVDGNPLTEIPFEFIGSENNDAKVDSPPIYDIAILNIAHYRNSADYEESIFMLGQPTPVFIGLTESWVSEILGGTVYLGARGSVPLPPNADAKLLQVAPNTLAYEALAHKEKQMVALGAKLVEQRKVQQTATEAEIQNASETSVLTNIADNVELAIIASLANCQSFVGNSGEIKFSLNKNFDLTALTAEEIRWLLECYNGAGIAFTELRQTLRRSGIATLNDDEARAAIVADMEMKNAVQIQPVATSAPVDEPDVV
jgi:hypothetical protein